MQEVIDRWCNSQGARGLSPNTVKRRRQTVERFERSGFDLMTATQHDLEGWLGNLRISPASRGLYLTDFRAFYRWALRQDILEVDPTVKIDAPKRPKYVPKPIPTERLKAAILAAPPRQRTMLILAGYAGLRAAEIASLRWEDIDTESRTIRIKGKGNKVRVVESHRMIEALKQPGATGYVMEWRGKPITPGAVTQALAAYLRGFGIDATGHQGRHTFGTRMYRECHDLAAVQDAMGHASPTTTRGYVQGNSAVARRAIDAMD